MEPISWSEKFSVGIDELDRQHKQIIKSINQLIEAKSLHSSSETISEILTQMRKFSEEHFACEEAYMQNQNYPGLEQQQKMHKDFKIQTAYYCNAVLEQ